MHLTPRARTRIGLVGLLALVVAAAGRLVLPAVEPGPSADRVALIQLSGQVQDAAPVLSTGQSITPRLVRDRLEQAAADPRIGAVVLRVNSPGGGPASSQEILDIIADHPDPVVVSVGDQAVSGGYYLALGADRIVAQPASLTGSIGVIFSMVDPTELLDDLGIDIQAITSGEHKDMYLPGRLNEERRAILQRQSDLVYDEFVDAVAEARDLPTGDVRELATGEMYTGTQALDAELVDELGGIETAVDAAAELGDLDRPEVMELRPGLLQQFTGPAAGLADALGAPDPARQLESLREAFLAPPELRLQQERR